MAENRLRVLVVDDTVVYRKIVKDLLSELPEVEVVGAAHNGRVALSRIAELKPDLLTLDIEMPEMNGLEVLEEIRRQGLAVGAIMLSTLTRKGGEMTMQALSLGAFDFVPKPQEATIELNMEAVRKALFPMIEAYRRQRELKKVISPGLARPLAAKPPSAAPAAGVRRASGQKSEIVAIGISTGGPNALARLLPMLPSDLGVPVLIVQHMPALFTQSLATSLNAKTALNVREAVEGEPLVSNTVLIAPGGRQMKIAAGADGRSRVIRLTDDPPENSCRPSVDYLFRSVADHYVGRATAVIMTGMGNDGTKGLGLLKKAGAITIAQSAETCVVYGMPKEAIESGAVDIVAPLDELAEQIRRTVRLV
ncbi:MAG: Chemotaxis response regulator protein-glutamate methylesterase [Deltaproteobacteria bacterium ADurb.Bin510]|nr:MAG: Chemotaxis response regulator protein-glutamate methylesterase [Deltaproteobacteria bacterium ADurb.Bin510]